MKKVLLILGIAVVIVTVILILKYAVGSWH